MDERDRAAGAMGQQYAYRIHHTTQHLVGLITHHTQTPSECRYFVALGWLNRFFKIKDTTSSGGKS